MSLIFSQTNVLTEEVHDLKAVNPSLENCIQSCRFIPGRIPGSTVAGAGVDADEESTDSTDAKPAWKKRRTRNDVIALQYRHKLKIMEAVRLNRQLTFKEGTNVFTIDPCISQEMEDHVRPGRKYKSRKPLYGKVVKQSPFFPRFWLVHFPDIKKITT